MASFYSGPFSTLLSFTIFTSSGKEGVSWPVPFLFVFLNISVVPDPNSCISISCGTVNLSWSFNQVLSLSPRYLSGSGLTENTYIIFVADVPTGGKSADCLDRELSGGNLGAAALSRTRTQWETSPGDFLSRLSKCWPLPGACEKASL